MTTNAGHLSNGHDWYRDSVVYQIYVRSFSDSDGDGVGDLPGITARIPEIASLGVDALWITPFYPSPMTDGGYDVSDYCDVHPLYGTLHDFDLLLAAAHSLGLRVIVDLVPNHTSSSHPWFTSALALGAESTERARYVFRAGRGPDGVDPPSDWKSYLGGPAWTRLPDGDWYLHLFSRDQPDLDWTNADVQAEFDRILRFWLDRGVDGFRIDVADGLAKDVCGTLRDVGVVSTEEGSADTSGTHPFFDRDEVHEIYRGWRKILEEYQPQRVAVAEAWVGRGRVGRYIREDELHQAFNFDFLLSPWSCSGIADVIDASLDEATQVRATPTWVLSNHDVVRHATRFALPGGTNVADWLVSEGRSPAIDEALGLRRARAAALLMLALPGSAYVYQGEELGLHEVADLPRHLLQDPGWTTAKKSRDGCRVPLPWTSASPSLGFGPGLPWLPQPASWAALSRAAQEGDPDSTLEMYRRAISLRRSLAGDRTLSWLHRGPDFLEFRRGEHWRCIVNFGKADMSLPAGELLLCSDAYAITGRLAPDSSAWLGAPGLGVHV